MVCRQTPILTVCKMKSISSNDLVNFTSPAKVSGHHVPPEAAHHQVPGEGDDPDHLGAQHGAGGTDGPGIQDPCGQ